MPWKPWDSYFLVSLRLAATQAIICPFITQMPHMLSSPLLASYVMSKVFMVRILSFSYLSRYQRYYLPSLSPCNLERLEECPQVVRVSHGLWRCHSCYHPYLSTISLFEPKKLLYLNITSLQSTPSIRTTYQSDIYTKRFILWTVQLS